MDLSNENVIYKEKEGVEYLQFKKLLEYKKNIKHLYTLGLDRNFRTERLNKEIDEKEYEKTIEDYKKFSNILNATEKDIIKPRQRHTKNVKIVKEKINKEAPDIGLEEYVDQDGLVTNKKGLILSTTNADCILLLFYDPVKNVIANTHSGWKGTVQRIAIETVKQMKEEYGSNPEDIICCICPSIRKCHFEVEKDVKEIFEKEFKDIFDEIEENKEIEKNKQIQQAKYKKSDILEETIKGKKWHIDTVLINKIILKKAGLKEENIIDSGICSVCHSEQIHSYRVEKEKFKLNTALIKLEK